MISESVLMLCCAHRFLDGDEYADEVGMFPMGYENHPCSKWVRESAANYNWLLVMVTQLAKEYYQRYGSKKKEPVNHNHAINFVTCFENVLAVNQHPGANMAGSVLRARISVMFQDVLLENRWFTLNKTGANAENDLGALIGFGVDQILQ